MANVIPTRKHRGELTDFQGAIVEQMQAGETIEASSSVIIHREEVHEAIKREGKRRKDGAA